MSVRQLLGRAGQLVLGPLVLGGCATWGEASVRSGDSETGAPRPAGVVASQQPTVDPSPTMTAAELIESARWVRRDGRDSLEVIPSRWQRDHPDEATIDTAWQQILLLHPEADRGGMRDQYACHVLFAPAKDVFYLEPWRVDVGHFRTVAEGCNPG